MVGFRKSTGYMAKHYFSDASVSLERADDSISILDLTKDSEVSVLIPHSDASAYHTMVSGSLLPLGWTYAHDPCKSKLPFK